MKTIRVLLSIGAIVIIIADLTFIDYSNLSWSKNAGYYMGIIAVILLIISMTLQIRQKTTIKIDR